MYKWEEPETTTESRCINVMRCNFPVNLVPNNGQYLIPKLVEISAFWLRERERGDEREGNRCGRDGGAERGRDGQRGVDRGREGERNGEIEGEREGNFHVF